MLSDNQLLAMLYLLEDDDEDVVSQIENQLLDMGTDILPILENYWTQNQDPVRGSRIEIIIKNIQRNSNLALLKDWSLQENPTLIDGIFLINRIQYPNLQLKNIEKFIENIRLDIWLGLNNVQNPLDKIQIMNNVLFHKFGFSGNKDNFNAPDNSYLNKVIETKKGNPISLSILYCIIAQRLGFPVFGINLPQHFIVAWCDDAEWNGSDSFKPHLELNRNFFGKELFYINPFSKGQIFGLKEVESFLESIKIKSIPEFYTACSNIDIIKRVLRNLQYSYGESNNYLMTEELKPYMQIFNM